MKTGCACGATTVRRSTPSSPAGIRPPASRCCASLASASNRSRPRLRRPASGTSRSPSPARGATSSPPAPESCRSSADRCRRAAAAAPIAWKTAATVLEHGQLKRGYLGVAGQPVRLPDNQLADGREEALLVVGVTSGSPAAAAGVLVGDVIVALDGQAVQSPEDLLDLLLGDRVGRQVTLRVLRAGKATELRVTVGERPTN
ncbi:MAG: hypothetical protein DMG04_24475 [Acidobacteria bacterium]|nr:MAG: hypothetical protein DMG04_24475 [Acidobacteriota bacterium]